MGEPDTDEVVQIETNGLGGGEGMDVGDMHHQLVSTIALQQKEIDSLNNKLSAVLKRLDTLESSASTQATSSRSGPMKALPAPRSAPSTSRRQTMDPRQMRNNKSEDMSDGPAGSKPGRRSVAPSSALSRRFQSREKLPAHREMKEEPGTYRMYLQGRPVTFRLPEGYEQPVNPEPAAAPEQTLKLDWVYGYRGKDCRNNIISLESGEILYFAAAVCVLHNIETGVQRHYSEHTDDVKSIALHPDRVTVASGQVAGHAKPVKGAKGGAKAAAADPAYMPHIRIWSSETLDTLKVVGAGTLDRAVACLSFSVTDGGQLLCAVDEHNDHRMSVWQWNKGAKGTKMAEMKASQDAVYQADFHPTEANQIVCCGKNQLSFWTFDGNKSLSKKMALFEKHDKPKFVTCLTFTGEGNVVTGDSNGNIFVWNKGSNKIGAVLLAAHDSVIFSVMITEDGSLVSGGGKDRLVKTWNLKEKVETSSQLLAEEVGAARVVVMKGDEYIVGSTKNNIVCGTNLAEATVVMQGHHGELWGLTEQRDSHHFITCAYDNHIKVWDGEAHKTLSDIELTESLQCVSLNLTGDILAIGSRTPNWYLYNTKSQQRIASGSCGNEQLECCQFSPDGEYVAFGSRDNNIYVHKVEGEGESVKLIGKCQGHTSFITHIDWSTDSSYLRSNSGDYELLYWEVPECKQFTDGDRIRDLKFNSQNCVLSLNTVGVWQAGADGTDINGCAVNGDQTLLASADDFGKVNLYRYPSRTPLANCHSYSGHSSHVTSVAFASTGKHLLSVGGKDSTVLQWNII